MDFDKFMKEKQYSGEGMDTPWEYLGDDTFRMEVPGGWLYRYKTTMLFVTKLPEVK